ncbi:MAG: tetratricopeptide repeat protein, partial [Planctomycetaceae bacterium]|nr:tetratricopeptide repeat protein [Planctomycetaceae bacterium]
MRINSRLRRAACLLLMAGLLFAECVTSSSVLRGDDIQFISPRYAGPYYGYRGLGRGRNFGHNHHLGFFHDHGLGIRTPPNVNHFVFRAPIAIAPYTYYYGSGFYPYTGYYGGYYGGYYPRYYGNPYYTYGSYYYGNNWWWSNSGFYGNSFNIPESAYTNSTAITLENKRMQEQVEQNRRDWIQKIPGMPDRVIIAVRPSTPEDNLKSVRSQALGDRSLQDGEYSKAYKYYQRAVKQSSDQAEFRISLAVVLAATGRFEPAHQQMEIVTRLQPDLKELPRTLEQIFRKEGDSEREKLMSQLSEWT